jgi:hypothetical protein
VRRGLVIGPADAGTDVNVVLSRTTSGAEPSPRGETTPSASTPAGYAHVNVWRLNHRGATSDDSAARTIADELARQAGFVSYALIRTARTDVVAVTIFESELALRRAMDAVAPLVRDLVRPLAAAGPERREGAVVHYRVSR